VEAEGPEEGQGPEEDVRRLPRYFNSGREGSLALKEQIICRRCSQPGHTMRNCPSEQRLACQYCLGRHVTGNCPTSTVCFRCGGFGHIVRECPARGMECFGCKKRGHRQSECMALRGRRQEGRGLLRLAACQTCSETGHVKCGPLCEDNVFFQLEKDTAGEMRQWM
jgi:cellular nucleic acid-binding protein